MIRARQAMLSQTGGARRRVLGAAILVILLAAVGESQPTPSSTMTPSASPAWSTLFDGTGALGYPPLAVSAPAINQTYSAAISFRVNETDALCGPGSWSLTKLWVPLSQTAGGATTVTVYVLLYTANVSLPWIRPPPAHPSTRFHPSHRRPRRGRHYRASPQPKSFPWACRRPQRMSPCRSRR